MENRCSTCIWWSKYDDCCLFCYLNGHSRCREGDQCFEYTRRGGYGERVSGKAQEAEGTNEM